jgi:hypothetical protein
MTKPAIRFFAWVDTNTTRVQDDGKGEFGIFRTNGDEIYHFETEKELVFYLLSLEKEKLTGYGSMMIEKYQHQHQRQPSPPHRWWKFMIKR